MIIYPPLIADIIPPCVYNTSKINIKIPFEWNPGVEVGVKYMRIQIKDYFTSEVIFPRSSTSQSEYRTTINSNAGSAQFAITPFTYSLQGNNTLYEFPIAGQYYKIQIAYDDSDIPSPHSSLTFSSVALLKCISSIGVLSVVNEPITTLDELWSVNPSEILTESAVYTGVYERNAIGGDPLHTYVFSLKNSLGEIVETSGEKRWNNQNDFTSNTNLAGYHIKTIYSFPSYSINYDLSDGGTYTLELQTISANGYTATVAKQLIQGVELTPTFNHLTLSAKAKEEMGGIELVLNFEQDEVSEPSSAQFSIERKVQNGHSWEVVHELALGNLQQEITLLDTAVIPQTQYEYRVRQFNRGKYSTPINGTKVSATLNLEDIILSDGEKLLRIQFNPKVSSMKNTILESKQDSIGGKYPTFYRNGFVNYRELPVSGLISHLMDLNGQFLNRVELGLERPTQTSLTNNNIEAERRFREAVLEWLTNGKPKLFRSATEGSFIVRLMNVSLSPNDTLGRMLWTFSATAYEIDENSMINLQKYHLLPIQDSSIGHNEFTPKALNVNTELNKNFQYVKNIIWVSPMAINVPVLSLTTLDNKVQIYANVGGVFKTPFNTLYKNMKVYDSSGNIAYSTISYEQSNSIYDPTLDNFPSSMPETEQKVKWAEVAERAYEGVLYIQITGYSNDSNKKNLIVFEDEEVTTRVEIGYGETREWYFNNQNLQINTLQNCRGIISYTEGE